MIVTDGCVTHCNEQKLREKLREEKRRGEVAPRPDVAQIIVCPISKEIMHDPVITADGHSYDRASIEQWFRLGKRTSPLTGVELPNTDVLPNISLKWSIDHLCKKG